MYAYYDETGKIVVNTTEKLESKLDYLELNSDISPSRYYILNKELVERPKLVAQDTVTYSVTSLFSVTEVPVGTKVAFKNLDSLMEVTDGVLEIELLTEGSWDLVLIPPFPFVTQVVKVVVQ